MKDEIYEAEKLQREQEANELQRLKKALWENSVNVDYLFDQSENIDELKDLLINDLEELTKALEVLNKFK